MYSIITKWTPNSSTARYLSFTEIEHIISTGNMENDLPLVAPEKYDAEIYGEWAIALVQYRQHFLDNNNNIDYKFFLNEQGSVITVQIFDLEEIHTDVLSQIFYNDFVSARQAFSALVDVSFEIKKVSLDLGAIDSYEMAASIFEGL